ncbi:MAG: hypothetical protein ABF272_08015 [Flavobacteriales bacterium]
MELGIVGGNDVSIIRGNLVDLETDLRGITRINSRCPTKKYQWKENTGITGEKTVQPRGIEYSNAFCKNPLKIDTKMRHLPPCQMIRYDPVPLPPPLDLPQCIQPSHKMQFS